jgi:hypothetical protein
MGTILSSIIREFPWLPQTKFPSPGWYNEGMVLASSPNLRLIAWEAAKTLF